MGRALHFEEHRNFQTSIFAAFAIIHFRNTQGPVRTDMFKLNRLFQSVARYILLNLRDHLFDRRGNCILIAIFAETVDGIAHDQRRFRRVEHDDGLAARRPADPDNGLARRFRKFIDIGARAWPGGF